MPFRKWQCFYLSDGILMQTGRYIVSQPPCCRGDFSCQQSGLDASRLHHDICRRTVQPNSGTRCFKRFQALRKQTSDYTAQHISASRRSQPSITTMVDIDFRIRCGNQCFVSL